MPTYIDNPAFHLPGAMASLGDSSLPPMPAAIPLTFIKQRQKHQTLSAADEKSSFLRYNFARLHSSNSPHWAKRSSYFEDFIIRKNLPLIASVMLARHVSFRTWEDVAGDLQMKLFYVCRMFDISLKARFVTLAYRALSNQVTTYYRGQDERKGNWKCNHPQGLPQHHKTKTDESTIHRMENFELLEKLLSIADLDNSQKQILRLRFTDDLTYKACGIARGRTGENIRCREKIALRKLRAAAESLGISAGSLN